ncbi:helix-hairpin-helix domain-containing protein [Virgibacillus salinus]|uniref:Pathogenicity locus n=1 Tax=Virgibacillus salinus TaxID=553311 RepID=A0A1H1DRJ0_9BACI|nr:helix-hairpin-helix domain-containing protein [Virgibacillus salinus]SDQ79047.1 Pathogenicity locus [Virgibacillus salinus]
MSFNPKLELTQNEKVQLRRAKIKISEVHTYSGEELAQILGISDDRARTVKALAEFQKVPSIGYELAEKLVHRLDIYSLKELKDQNGAELLDELEQRLGVWTDPCVEDQIRCVVYFANDPSSSKKWFDFTKERKDYRTKIGYPENRPKKAWYE